MDGPLVGVKVVEMGSAIAGPLCAALLGDMGADVVKVESPKRGDDSRGWGDRVKGESLYFVNYNRNKRSLALDVKDEEGREALLRLLDGSDVLVENFRPGVMDRLSLSYDSLRRRNKGLIYCCVSGFGQTGPYSQLGGYDAINQAICGLMSVTGEESGQPLRVGVPITDIVTAFNAAYSVALALLVRERSGEGQMIDISLFETGVLTVGQWITIASLTGREPRRFGNRYPLLAPYELFEASDKPFVVAVGNDQLWAELCTILGKEGLAEDPRFRTNADRISPENRPALTEILQKEFRRRTAREWVGAMWKVGIPAGAIATVGELTDDPQLRARNAFVEVEHATLGRIRVTAPTPKFSTTGGTVCRAAPTLGQHTDEVLEELGYDRDRLRALRQRGVIG